MAESCKKLKSANVFSSFIACYNRNRSALLRELLIIHCLSVSCTRINHSCCALMIWSSLQLTSKQWIITQQFTARVDLFFNYSKFLKFRRSIRAQHRKLENRNLKTRCLAIRLIVTVSMLYQFPSWCTADLRIWTSLWSVHLLIYICL